jgi:hypothetical protein
MGDLRGSLDVGRAKDVMRDRPIVAAEMMRTWNEHCRRCLRGNRAANGICVACARDAQHSKSAKLPQLRPDRNGEIVLCSEEKRFRRALEIDRSIEAEKRDNADARTVRGRQPRNHEWQHSGAARIADQNDARPIPTRGEFSDQKIELARGLVRRLAVGEEIGRNQSDDRHTLALKESARSRSIARHPPSPVTRIAKVSLEPRIGRSMMGLRPHARTAMRARPKKTVGIQRVIIRL